MLCFLCHKIYQINNIKKMQILHTHTHTHTQGRTWSEFYSRGHLSEKHTGEFQWALIQFPIPVINSYWSTVRLSCTATIMTGRMAHIQETSISLALPCHHLSLQLLHLMVTHLICKRSEAASATHTADYPRLSQLPCTTLCFFSHVSDFAPTCFSVY